MTRNTPGPNNAERNSANKIAGMLFTALQTILKNDPTTPLTSIKRERRRPKIRLRIETQSPINKEISPPLHTRESRSLPKESVPKKNFIEGGR